MGRSLVNYFSVRIWGKGVFNFYLRNIRNLHIMDLLKNAGFPEVEAVIR
jgi:hypothetical protein